MQNLGDVRDLGGRRRRAPSAEQRYKFQVVQADGTVKLKADPFAFAAEVPPHTASVVHAPEHAWGDDEWLARRRAAEPHRGPMSIYEVHLGSWRRNPLEDNRSLTYRELAKELADYVARPRLHARRAAAGHGAPVLAARGATR